MYSSLLFLLCCNSVLMEPNNFHLYEIIILAMKEFKIYNPIITGDLLNSNEQMHVFKR